VPDQQITRVDLDLVISKNTNTAHAIAAYPETVTGESKYSTTENGQRSDREFLITVTSFFLTIFDGSYIHMPVPGKPTSCVCGVYGSPFFVILVRWVPHTFSVEGLNVAE